MKRMGIAVLVIGALVLVGCTSQGTTQNAVRQSAGTEQLSIADGLINMLKSQPLPRFSWSQLRQNLIEIESAQSITTQTTSFFFNMGVADPVQTCPSLGYPIASTTELSNPVQRLTDSGTNGGNGNVVIPQIDPNGVYAGQSTGTYVMCVDAQGRAYADYWEGFVQTVTGPAVWNAAKHAVELVGPPSFKFSTQKKG